MRILNTKDAHKKYSKFCLPGFRSGSVVKKIIACMYYFFVLFFAINSIRFTLKADFVGANDVFLAIIVELIIVLIMLAPVIIIGMSDHYDWHGIKLVLIILIAWCVLFTAAQFVSTLFSEEFINSTNSNSSHDVIPSDSINSDAQSDIRIDNDIIIDNMTQIDENKSDASSKE